MKNIFKQLEGSAINLKNKSFKKAVIRLTTYYTIGVFLIILVLSSIFYVFVNSEIDENLKYYERDENSQESMDFEDSPLHEFQEDLLNNILIIDLIIFLLVLVSAYFLSIKTLKPLEDNYFKQKRFIANASHDLKTPLTVMKAGIETALRKDRTEEEYIKYLKETLEEVNILDSLSKDLLSMNKEYNREVNESLNISETLKEQINKISNYSNNKKIKITSDVSDNILFKIKEIDFQRIVMNLLKNAVDYNFSEGIINVSLKKNLNNIILEISNTSVGIPSEKLPYIFDPFYKVDDSRTQKISGSNGLGLSIVKELVESSNGKISVQSEINGKTTFIIKF